MSQLVAGVGFDIDHTLVIDNKLERVAFLRLLELVLDDGGHPLGSLADETDHIDTMLSVQRAGAFSIDDAVRRFVLERGAIPKDSYVERFREMATEMVGDFVVPLPGAKQVLAALRERGILVAVLSNGWNPLQVLKARRAGFDGPVVASADVGAQKPSPEAFRALLAALGTPPDRTWYVGDDPHGDIAGATAVGINAVWLDAERKIYPTDLTAPPHVITSLYELLHVLPSRERAS
jgi:HAD superfamily hydrolase (TIGR01509 family)